MLLVADIDIPYLNGVFEPFFNQVIYKKGTDINARDIRNADALVIRTRTNCNKTLLQDASKLKLIVTATVGTDHIDLKYCQENGIKVASAAGCNAGGVLQWVQASILDYLSRLEINPCKCVLGVVGAGNIGKRVIETGNALGMNVLVNDPPRQVVEGNVGFTDLNTLASESNIITFHVPLSNEGEYPTFNLANEIFLKKVKAKSLIINSSRGGVVNESALQKAIVQNSINAAIDVWYNEPSISLELLKLVNIATPHIAGYSLEGKVNATVMTVNAVSRFFNLGLDSWQLTPNPSEYKNEISVDNYLNIKTINLNDLLNNVYPIKSDDEMLRSSPKHFDAHRNSYKLRRENSGYVLTGNISSEVELLLQKLEFKTGRI